MARRLLGMTPERVHDIWQPQELPDPWEDLDLADAVARCAKERECGEARLRGAQTFFQISLEHMPAFDEHRGGVLIVVRDLSETRRLEANQQRFLANATNELKTPITAILGAAELLLTEKDDDPRVRERFLTHIRSEAERMQRLSETLLQLAQTGWDHRDPKIGEVDPSEMVSRRPFEPLDVLYSERIRLCYIRFSKEPPARGNRVRTDGRQPEAISRQPRSPQRNLQGRRDTALRLTRRGLVLRSRVATDRTVGEAPGRVSRTKLPQLSLPSCSRFHDEK